MEEKTMLIIAGVAIALLLVVGGLAMFIIGTYNTLQKVDVNVENAKAYVQSAYQRRADLIPNLVATVQGSADFEKSTLVELTAMRSQAGMIQQKMKSASSVNEMQAINDNEIGGTGGILARLMLVVEAYPQIRSTEAFTNLQSSIEGTENRINYERNAYNDAVAVYKMTVRTFPGNIVAGFFGYSADKWVMFEAKQGSDVAPTVTFNFKN